MAVTGRGRPVWALGGAWLSRLAVTYALRGNYGTWPPRRDVVAPPGRGRPAELCMAASGAPDMVSAPLRKAHVDEGEEVASAPARTASGDPGESILVRGQSTAPRG